MSPPVTAYESKPLDDDDHPARSATLTVLLLLMAIASGLVTLCLFVAQLDFESWLVRNWPWRHRGGAFLSLNQSIPVFMLMLTGVLTMACWIHATGRRSLVIPLLAGPLICVVGWAATEDFGDPLWFHLFALTSIGMLVSCLVTLVLAPVTKPTRRSSTSDSTTW